MFDRLEKLIGKAKLDEIKASNVLLVGVGGVGGTCLETLVRSGFNSITVVDYDRFEESNLNRQILSNVNVINKKKVLVAASRAKLINPDINIKLKDIFLDEENIKNLGRFDYIIDACDFDIVPIHDSFAALPCDVDAMRAVLLDQFVRLYEQDVLSAIEYSNVQGITIDRPVVGNLDLNVIRKSRFAFS